MSKAHAFLPPSGAGAWVKCPLWPTMNAAYPRPPSPESEEGEAAHWVLTQEQPRVGDVAPNGAVVSDEMLIGAEMWHDALGPREFPCHVEETLPATEVIHPDCWGTPDLWAVCEGTLQVADYKYGHGIVPAVENWQLLTYAALALHSQDMPAVGVDRIVLTIVQPRGYGAKGGPVRHWEVDVLDMPEYIRTLHDAAALATGDNPPARPGPHCGYCPGRHACSALQEAGGYIADYSGRGYRSDLTAAQLGYELRALDAAADLLDARRTGLQEQAVAMIRRGEPVPHYRLDSTAGREEWTRPIDEVLALGEALGVPLSKPAAPITPAQARKAGLDKDLVAAFSQRKPGATKLVADDGAEARQAFAGGAAT